MKFLNLFRAGIDKDLVLGDPTAPRFVYWENKLRATPSGPDALTFDLLSIWGKIRAGLGAVGLYKSGPMPSYEESVEQFIRVRSDSEKVLSAHDHAAQASTHCDDSLAAWPLPLLTTCPRPRSATWETKCSTA